jgi:hypothetical protein
MRLGGTPAWVGKLETPFFIDADTRSPNARLCARISRR